MCSKCGQHPKYVQPNGRRQAWCLECYRVSNRAWREQNRDRHRAMIRAWESANRDRVRETDRAKRARNIESARQSSREWNRRHPEVIRALSQERRARQRGAFVERVDLRRRFEMDMGICYLCESPVDPTNWHLDHVVPLVSGGEHSYANTRVTHPYCNMSKGPRGFVSVPG